MSKLINAIKSFFIKPKDSFASPDTTEPLPQPPIPSDEEPPTMYIEIGGTIYKPNGGTITDEEIPYLMEVGYRNAMKFHADREAMLGITEHTLMIASKFHIAHMEQLKYLDEIFLDCHMHKNNPTEALKALYEIKEFCFRYGESGREYYKQRYEQLFNSKNPCFSFEEIILEAVEKEKIFKPIRERIYPEILQIFNENGSVLQKDLYSRYSDIENTVARHIIYKLYADGHIIKSKQGRYRVLTMETDISREMLDKYSKIMQ